MARKRRQSGGKGGSDGKPRRKRQKKNDFEPRPTNLVNHGHMHALSNRERVEILALLCEGVASPKELSRRLGKKLGRVSYHTNILKDHGLIAERDQAPRRGAMEHFYSATWPTVVPPSSWDKLPTAMKERVSGCIVREFLDDAATAAEAGLFDEPPGELSWTPLILDSAGVEEIGRLTREFADALMEAQKHASERLAGKGGGKPVSATVFLASFLSARNPEDGKKASATKRR